MLCIALTGFAGCGKSTAAEYLARRYTFTRTRFADPLKHMLASLLRKRGCTEEYILRCIEGDMKTKPVAEFAGRTPRYAMQKLGTEWGRDLMSQNFWVDAWADSVKGSRSPVVAEDCRFHNEADAVKKLGGLVWRIARPGLVKGDHQSEVEQTEIEVDFQILNNGTVRELHSRIDQIMREMAKKARALASG